MDDLPEHHALPKPQLSLVLRDLRVPSRLPHDNLHFASHVDNLSHVTGKPKSKRWSSLVNSGKGDRLFHNAVQGLLRGDFSRLEPLFDGQTPAGGRQQCQILEWHRQGYFQDEPKALEEAFTCACFLGRTSVAEFLLSRGVDPGAGDGTGLNAFHWAAAGGQLEIVKLLIERKAPLETKNRYGGTVLGQAVWSAIHEPKPNQIAVIEALIGAGAQLETTGYPTGNERVDEALRRHGAKP